MKNIPTLLISVTLIIIVVKINYIFGNNNDEETELQNFLELLRQDSKVISRKSFIGDDKYSIQDFCKKTDSGGSIVSWTITQENLFESAQLINTVVSCEYCDIIYYYITLIDSAFMRLLSKKNQSDTGNEISLNLVLEQYKIVTDVAFNHLSPMILTLAGLMNLTKHNIASKNYDVFRILLSWYTYTARMVQRCSSEGEKNIESKITILDNINIANYQTRSLLEQFMIKYCYSFEELMALKTEIKNRIENMKDDMDRTYVEKIDILVSRITYPRFVDKDEKNRFIFSSKQSNEELITLISEELSTKIVGTPWDDKPMTLRWVYTQRVSKSLYVRPIITYEKIILDKIIAIIIGYESDTLKRIADGVLGTNRGERCNELLLDKIEAFRKTLEGIGHPTYLLNYVIAIKVDLLNVCSMMAAFDVNRSSITKFIARSDELKEQDFNGKDLDAFLSALSGMVICGRFHPAISNPFLERYDYFSTLSPDFTVDYQFLYSNHMSRPRQRPLCDKMSKVLSDIESLVAQIETCSTIRRGSVAFGHCYGRFVETYHVIIIDIGNVISNCLDEKDILLKRFALTLIQNEAHVVDMLSNFHQQLTDDNRMRRLIKFTHFARLEFDVLNYVTCGVALSNRMGLRADQQHVESNAPCAAWTVASFDDLKREKRLESIFERQKKFADFAAAARRLPYRFANVDLRLYWRGTGRTLPEVNDVYGNETFDIQDFYDYSYYVLKWMTTVTYFKLTGTVGGGNTELTNAVREFLESNRPPVTDLMVRRHISDHTEDLIFYADTLWLTCENYLIFAKQSLPLSIDGDDTSSTQCANVLFSDIKLTFKIYEKFFKQYYYASHANP